MAGCGTTNNSGERRELVDIPVVGDWDGNGTATPGVVRNGIWYLRNSNTSGIADLEIAYGNPSDLFLTGDWDNDDDDSMMIVRGVSP